jgi:hypothetical protein
MKWNDEYWPLLVWLYKRKPEGVKAVYSHELTDIAMHLHIHPSELHRKMMELRNPKTPYLKHVLEEYQSQRKLNKAVKTLMEKEGYGTSGRYYDEVDTNESWELDFRPLEARNDIMPVQLIIILDQYFRLTPTTMVTQTEEIQDLAKLMKMPAALIVQIMEIYQFCDPYLNRSDMMIDPLLFPCQEIWNRYGNEDTVKLEALAAQLKEYFR